MKTPEMTLLDWFAGQALAGEMATWTVADAGQSAGLIATKCYQVAAAMITMRNQINAADECCDE